MCNDVMLSTSHSAAALPVLEHGILTLTADWRWALWASAMTVLERWSRHDSFFSASSCVASPPRYHHVHHAETKLQLRSLINALVLPSKRCDSFVVLILSVILVLSIFQDDVLYAFVRADWPSAEWRRVLYVHHTHSSANNITTLF